MRNRFFVAILLILSPLLAVGQREGRLGSLHTTVIDGVKVEYYVPQELTPKLAADGLTLLNGVQAAVYIASPVPPAVPIRILPPDTVTRGEPANAASTFSITYIPNGGADPWGQPCLEFPAEAKAAFNAAASIWASLIQSSVPITIKAGWADLGGSTLGYSGGGDLWRDFSGAPKAATWYSSSLANSLYLSDLSPANCDMHITYNKNFSWYYGTDGNTPVGQYDFFSVVLHEIAHGLNFAGSMSYSGGQGSWGYNYPPLYPNAYDTFMRDGGGTALTNTATFPNPSTALGSALTSNSIWFHGPNAMAANGGQRVKMYAPSTWAGGSSYSHLDYSTFAGTANRLMVYAIASASSVHDPGPVTKGLLTDLGWIYAAGATPTVTTTAVSSVTATNAVSGGNVTSDGGASVTDRGVCVSTSANPTTANAHTHDGSGTGAFTSSLAGCTPATTYHVRAYATNSVGTAYGSDLTFTTLSLGAVLPTVTTTAVSSLTKTSFMTGGNVTSAGSAAVTDRGVCVSTATNPTIANAHTHDGTGTGVFVSSLTGGTPGETYHVRAYATSTAGTAYGNDIWFQTLGGTKSDFNADGQSDILWRNMTTGENAVWFMGYTMSGVTNLQMTGLQNMFPGAGPVRETGDLFKGKPGIVYLDPREGMKNANPTSPPAISVGPMGARGLEMKPLTSFSPFQGGITILGLTRTSVIFLPSMMDFNWVLVGTGDFNGDGWPDIVWRNMVTGENGIWYFVSGTRIGTDYMPSVTDLNWKIVGTGDFNGDKKPDLVWRNSATGENYIWFMNGAARIGGDTPPSVTDRNWTIVGTGDFSGDGKSDFLWHNVVTGENYIWFMEGATKIGGDTPPMVSDVNWQIGGVDDFNGDGRPDILWRNYLTGENGVWYMNGALRIGVEYLPSVADLAWKIVNR